MNTDIQFLWRWSPGEWGQFGGLLSLHWSTQQTSLLKSGYILAVYSTCHDIIWQECASLLIVKGTTQCTLWRTDRKTHGSCSIAHSAACAWQTSVIDLGTLSCWAYTWPHDACEKGTLQAAPDNQWGLAMEWKWRVILQSRSRSCSASYRKWHPGIALTSRYVFHRFKNQ